MRMRGRKRLKNRRFSIEVLLRNQHPIEETVTGGDMRTVCRMVWVHKHPHSLHLRSTGNVSAAENFCNDIKNDTKNEVVDVTYYYSHSIGSREAATPPKARTCRRY